MKILFLTNHLNGNDGWSRFSLEFIKKIKKKGHNVLCLTHNKSNINNIKEIVILGEPLEYLCNPIKFFFTANKVSKIIKDFSPDIIHFIVEPYAMILPFLIIKKAKTVLTVHGTYSVMPFLLKNVFKKRISHWISKKYYNKLDIIISVSNFTKFHLIKVYPKLNNKIKVISNGIDFKKNQIISVKNTDNKIKRILSVGAIKSRKGIIKTIEALKYYNDNFSKNFIYNIIGNYNVNDSYYKKIIKKIKEYNFSDKIILREKVSDIEKENYYKNSDLFLLLSINNGESFEGFGLVYLEANVCGLPVIGTYGCGAGDAIKNGYNGYLVNPDSPREVAEKIVKIFSDNDLYQKMSKNAVDWAKNLVGIKQLICI
ncbi:glycosyltransferase family 4 protein [bacterium]|nr:glycosyltransferase family 4 protein [bacterium]